MLYGALTVTFITNEMKMLNIYDKYFLVIGKLQKLTKFIFLTL